MILLAINTICLLAESKLNVILINYIYDKMVNLLFFLLCVRVWHTGCLYHVYAR